MSPADVEEVLAIERASFRFPWSGKSFLADLALPYAVWRVARPATARGGPTVISRRPRWSTLSWRHAVAERTRPVLGYAGVQVILDEGHITNVAVHPDYRHQGIGELLLLDLFDQVRPRGVLRLTLEVRLSNLAAQGLYHKYGFEVEGRRLRYYGDGEDALIMWSGRLDLPEMQDRLEGVRRQLWQRMEAV
jgi:ribosomal-protein-alanine N-acetyltransferase